MTDFVYGLRHIHNFIFSFLETFLLVTEVCFSRLLGRQLVVIMSVRSIIHLSLKNCCFLSLHKSNQLNASTQRLDDQTTHQLRPLKKVGSIVFTGVTKPQWFDSKYVYTSLGLFVL